MTNKIKITKEQYNRIFASKLISESHIKEKGNDLKNECIDLIKYFYGKTKDLSPFWEQHGLTYDEICEALLQKHIIIEKDGHYEMSKKLGTAENAKEILEVELKRLLSSKEAGINEMETEKNINNISLKVLGAGNEISILTDGTNLYVINNDELSSGPLTKNDLGYGFKDWDNGDKRIVQIDPELKNDLIMMYDKDENIINVLNPKENIEEMTGASSAGAFTPALSLGNDIEEEQQPIKKKIYSGTVSETTTASPSTVGPYDANALPGITRSGAYKKTPKTKAEKNTQWSGGAFVKMDNCTKLNNNKEAQNGGCSQGAVDNVVKLKKTSGNINAPSLKEDTKK